MRSKLTNIFAIGTFWLSLLLHLLFLISFTVVFFPHQDDEKNPDLYIPSYISSNGLTPYTPPPAPAKELKTPPVTKPTPQKLEKPVEQSKDGIEKPAKTKSAPAPSSKQASKFESMTPSKGMQGVHLIGEEKIDKSLRTILGKAIARHLFYPTNAIEFNVKGTVLIGFTLHPDGQVTGVQMVKPSNAGILNAAALSAINSISPVFGVEGYINEPKYLVIGIIFD